VRVNASVGKREPGMGGGASRSFGDSDAPEMVPEKTRSVRSPSQGLSYEPNS